ncbi:hypothetical protein HOT75_gp042 [Gordonia phage Daredevil]|uniref:Uncharacterized protein n=1 Tax=Gordonia phage Daredevil TaxID=2283286 RepID=A0A345MJ21_9CAUD|nr:hypothetical protein HOT75_gp042 [Gordonia phage Daredevil]AXH70552.1 hypothetical protein SEA_DAREDEVIL_42 [Gordonia phage Daredevil]
MKHIPLRPPTPGEAMSAAITLIRLAEYEGSYQNESREFSAKYLGEWADNRRAELRDEEAAGVDNHA